MKSSSASAPLSRKVINPPPVLNYIHNYPISRPKSIYEIRIGQYVTGYVHNIQEFGIFIDFGVGKHGLLHNKEVPPTAMPTIKRNVKLNVFVISCDIKNGKARIGLSFTQTPRDRRSHSRSRERAQNQMFVQQPLGALPRQNTSFVGGGQQGILKRSRPVGGNNGLYQQQQPEFKRRQVVGQPPAAEVLKPIMMPSNPAPPGVDPQLQQMLQQMSQSQQHGLPPRQQQQQQQMQYQPPRGVMPPQMHGMARGRGRDANNMPAWMMMQQQTAPPAAPPIMQQQQQQMNPVVNNGRGRGRGNNMPAWMIQQQQQQQQLQPIAQQQPTNVDSQVLGLLDMIAGGK